MTLSAMTPRPADAQRLRCLQVIAQAAAAPSGATLAQGIVDAVAIALGAKVVLLRCEDAPGRPRVVTIASSPPGSAGIAAADADAALAVDAASHILHEPPGAAAASWARLAGESSAGAAMARLKLADGAGVALGYLVAAAPAALASGDVAYVEAALTTAGIRLAAELERERSARFLEAMALAVTGAEGRGVFRELVRGLASALQVDVAFVARFAGPDEGALTMLAMHLKGSLAEDLPYQLAGTPCATVVGREFRAYPDHLQELFPDDRDFARLGIVGYAGYPLFAADGSALGLISIASCAPLVNLPRIESMLKIFAGRAAAEIERLDAGEALRRSEASYRAIFEAAEDAIFIHDWETASILDVNPKACETCGYSRDEMLALSVTDLSSGVAPYTAQDAAHWFALAREGRCPAFEWHRRNRDGSLHWDEVRLKPVVIGGRRHILAFTREITERKLAEEALRASEAQYRAIFNASVDALILWDSHYRRVDVNPAYERMYGWSREEVIGQAYDHHDFPPDYARQRMDLVRRALAGETCHVELEAVRKNGERLATEVRAIPFRHRGEPHVLAILRDITGRKRAEAEREALELQLRQAQKMEAIGHLTGGIAHDFNNILTSIIGFIVLAQEEAERRGDATIVRQLAQADRAAQRARHIIARMLAFSRQSTPERRVVAVGQIIDQTLSLLRSTLPSTIDVDAAQSWGDGGDTRFISADPVQIEQVLFNLCINARDAIEGTGWIRVRARQATGDCVCASCRSAVRGGQWVELSVSDSGSGIAPAIAERIFEPFVSSKPVGQGSGMGLAMVHGIVHQHGGHVCVESAPGRGATFRVLLPALAGSQPAAVAADAVPPPSAPPLLEGAVLIVEDDPIVGDYLVERLRGWGLAVRWCRNPGEAAALVEQPDKVFDVLLTDQTMPSMTGLQLAMRAHRVRPALPIVLISGNTQVIDAAEARNYGVRVILPKPLDAATLRQHLEAALAAARE